MTHSEPLCDVLLIQPRQVATTNINPLPFGLLFVAASLRRAGFHPRVVDLNVCDDDALAPYLKSEQLLFVGFSAITGPMLLDILRTSEVIRRIRPSVPLVWGGPHPTIVSEETAKDDLVDIVCRGEGEDTVVEIARALANRQSLERVLGITFKRGGATVSTPARPQPAEKNLDQTMFLDLHTINLAPYVYLNRGKKTCFMLTSRGCPGRCTFCWNVTFHERRYKAWSADKVCQELTPLFKSGVEKLLLLDSFAGSLSRVRSMGQMLLEHHIEWALEDGCRVDYHGKTEFFEILAQTGCTHVTYGAESGSQSILDKLHKDITTEDIVRTASRRRPFPIGARYQWMVGIPGETRDDMLQTVELMDRLTRINSNTGHSVDMYSPYPGCELFNEARQAGWVPPRSISEWGQYRWEAPYPHHMGNTWFIKSIFYSSLFANYERLARYSAYTENAAPMFRAARKLLHPSSVIRWKRRLFDYPLEYWVSEQLRKHVERMVSRMHVTAKRDG